MCLEISGKPGAITLCLGRLRQGMPLALVIFALSAGLVSPFYFSRKVALGEPRASHLISTHDMAEHLIVMEQFDKVLRSGVIYPRWLPDLNKGYGSAWPDFYPPGFYYLTSTVHILVTDWVNTLFIVTILVLGGSFLAFYKLSRTFYGRFASSGAALLYLLWPYHILNLYWRGAMPEFAGFALAPLMLFFAHQLGECSRGRYYIGLGLSYGALILIHLPGGYLLSWPVALYGVLLGLDKKDWKAPLRVWAGLGIGLLIAAIYWLPAAIESKYAYENISAIFPYGDSYLPLLRPANNFGEVLNKAAVVQAAALLAALLVIWSLKQHAVRHYLEGTSPGGPGRAVLPATRPVRLFAVLALATTLMSTVLSAPISSLMPKIQLVGFPCRWLVVSGLFTALVMGAAIESLTNGEGKSRVRLWIGATALLAVTALNVGATIRWVILGALVNPSLKIPESLVEPNYTPKDGLQPDQLPDVPLARLMLEGGSALIARWDPEYREITEESSVESFLRLKTYYFPGWKASIDGHPAKIIGDASGVQMIPVPPGTHKVDVYLVNTPARSLGAVCSAVGLLFICVLALAQRSKVNAAPSPPQDDARCT